MKKFTAIFAAILFSASAAQAIDAGVQAPDFKTTDINGKAESISQYKGKIIVLEWTNPDCPFVKKFYEPGKMQELQKQAKADGVVWLSINSSAEGKEGSINPEQAKSWVSKAKSEASAYILDPKGIIGKEYGAASTPTAVVIDKSGKVAYFGAVDDKPSFKQEDIATAKNYITEAIKSVKAGTALATPQTKSYGCGVKYAD